MPKSSTPASVRQAVADAIRDARLRAQKRQEAIALAAGVSRSYISSLEGGRHDPSFGVMLKIADALGVPLLTLVEDILLRSPERVKARRRKEAAP